MIWIRIILAILIVMMAIYYGMLILQCMTSWFKMTNRSITFIRCLVPFYYWIAPVEEKDKETLSDYSDEYEEQIKKQEEKEN